MDKRTAERKHKKAIKAGKVVQFYDAKPRPKVAEAEEEFNAVSALEVLKDVLTTADDLKDVLVLMRDNKDVCGLVSNLDGPAENLFFLKVIESQLIAAAKETAPDTGPKKA
jgi:hypothetical protein